MQFSEPESFRAVEESCAGTNGKEKPKRADPGLLGSFS